MRRALWIGLAKYLDGRKTYSVVYLTIAYAVGSKLELWSMDPEVLAVLIALSVASIRSAIKKNELPQD